MTRNNNASSLTVTGGVGRGMILTTVDITFGGGVKADGRTLKPLAAMAYQCVSSVRLPYALVPGLAYNRSATSRWSMTTAQCRRGRSASSRGRMGADVPEGGIG